MYESRIADSESVGPETIALSISTPESFDAHPGQFVLIRAEIDGEEETGYYTISSPDVTDAFEITVGVDPDGTLGPWLADRSAGETLAFDGPFGDVEYTGGDDAVVLAAGPGIGPAVGIAERALQEGREVELRYKGASVPHRDRIDAVADAGGTVTIGESVTDVTARIETAAAERTVYVFGFAGFVEAVKDELEDAGVSLDDVEIESFGPA